MDKYSKNSLLGQLKQNGFISKEEETNEQGFLPFGLLTGASEPSPFENSENKIIEENNTNPIEAPAKKIVKKRLNDLDANFFNESSFLNIDDVELTEGEKIKKIKSMINKVDKKIFMLEDSDDDILLEKLNNEKETLEHSLRLLDIKEGETVLPVKKNAGKAITTIKDKVQLSKRVKKIEKTIFKIFPFLYKNYLVRKALNKLIMLNESAKELMLKKIPYGESESRYNDFTAYMSCANVIHAKLSKKI